ncbi:MAG: hypothetical protein FJ349_02715 [Sphingomonadales bacterium]|nr:hypothetical protein [Sphingomonadales bacterium]
MSNIQKLLRVLLALELLVIVYFSLKSPQGGVNVQLNDKVGHFIGYGILSLNTFLVFGFRSKWHTTFILLFLIGWGVLMEWLQGFVPGREVSGWDIVANAIGVAIGTSFYYVRRRFLV